jgi:GT2 family glycosyltransferase
MGVDVVIVNWNGGPELIRAVESAIAFGGRPIVVDNASTTGSIGDVAARADATVIRNGVNLGFAAGCNRGVAAGSNEYVFLLNPDAEIVEGSATDVAGAFDESGATLMGPRTQDGAGRPLLTVRPLAGTSGLLMDLLRVNGLRRRILPRRRLDEAVQSRKSTPGWVVGAAAIIRRRDWNRLNGMDEAFFLWHEDEDFGARASENGGGVALAPRILVRHLGASTWSRLPRRRRQWLRASGAFRYARRHLGTASALAIALITPLALAIGIAHDAVALVIERR